MKTLKGEPYAHESLESYVHESRELARALKCGLKVSRTRMNLSSLRALKCDHNTLPKPRDEETT